MNVEQRMRTALKEGADGLSFPEAGPDAARERARQRARRRQAGTGGLTALAMVAAGITGWQLLPDEQVQFEGPASSPGDGSTAHALADLDWRNADGVVGARSKILHSSDGLYYALSTAQGTATRDYPGGDVPQALYRSSDGLSWEAAELGEDPWIADLDERDGVLYAVSTAPATSGQGSGRTGVSTDGGRTWNHVDLPSTAAPPDADVALNGPFITASIAVGEDVVLARTSTTYAVDATDVFSDEELEGDHYVLTTDEGLRLMGDECVPVDESVHVERAAPQAQPQSPAQWPYEEAMRCWVDEERMGVHQVVKTVPWSELGLESHADLRVDELFRSTDGETWEPIDASAFAGRYVQDLTAGPQGFFAVTHPPTGDGPPAVELLRSTDGTTWKQLDATGPVSALGFVGERIVGTASYDERGLEAVTSDDGGATWTRTDLADLVDPEQEAQHVGVYNQATGPLGAAIVAATYSGEDADAQLHLLASGDGVTWSVTPLTDIVGEDLPNSVSWVAVGEDSIALAAAWYQQEGPARTRTFVGTPTR